MLQIECSHGFFKFTELKSGQVSQFKKLYELDLERHPDGFFTFPFLIDAPKYSIEGSTYLGAQALETFEGEPWEIMKANSLIYDFVNDEVVPVTSITTNLQINQAEFYFFSSGLIMPGSLTKAGSRVVDYSAFFLRDMAKFKYSGVGYV